MRDAVKSLIACAFLSVTACGDTTGGARVSFAAAAAGPSDASGGPLTFTNSLGYRVTLTRATLHIGAVYLNETVPTSGSQETACILPGVYVAQVLSALDVSVLSPELQPFPTMGQGTTTPAKAGELWLTGGDVSSVTDPTVILNAAGTAVLGASSYPFEARLTIGKNRLIPSLDPAFPGMNPICKQRIVSRIPVDLIPRQGGTLVVRTDPRAWFVTVDFADLPKVSDAPLLYRFTDTNDNTADLSLYNNGLRSTLGVYSFEWQ